MFTFLWLSVIAVQALQSLPPISSNADDTDTSASSFDFSLATRTVYITSDIAEQRDDEGLTLIPPSGQEFAALFVEELSNATKEAWSLKVVDTLPDDGAAICLTSLPSNHSLTYENGQATEEGYQLEANSERVLVSGSGARGMWWGTRTVLQELYLSNFTSIAGVFTSDAPAYATRGYMLDAGRKWYPPGFLKELCTFASFFSKFSSDPSLVYTLWAF